MPSQGVPHLSCVIELYPLETQCSVGDLDLSPYLAMELGKPVVPLTLDALLVSL